MCFFGNRLEVSGRDRNDVPHDDLTAAIVHVLKRTSQTEALTKLLKPLHTARNLERPVKVGFCGLQNFGRTFCTRFVTLFFTASLDFRGRPFLCPVK